MQIKNMMISQLMAVTLMATLGCPYAAAAQRLTPLPHPVGVLQQPLFQANSVSMLPRHRRGRR